MTKKFHKCDVCKGTEGIYVKVCKATGEQIETYKEQFERLARIMRDDRNFVLHNPGVDEH